LNFINININNSLELLKSQLAKILELMEKRELLQAEETGIILNSIEIIKKQVQQILSKLSVTIQQ
jgi:hypothetical protein